MAVVEEEEAGREGAGVGVGAAEGGAGANLVVVHVQYRVDLLHARAGQTKCIQPVISYRECATKGSAVVEAHALSGLLVNLLI